MLSPGEFDAKRDILAIAVNRWPHGYAYTYETLADPDLPEEASCTRGTAFGRIAIANADAGASTFTCLAIDQAHRAVQGLPCQPRSDLTAEARFGIKDSTEDTIPGSPHVLLRLGPSGSSGETQVTIGTCEGMRRTNAAVVVCALLQAIFCLAADVARVGATIRGSGAISAAASTLIDIRR